ncbi:MAG: M56 family metallopeptidase [Pseudomonadota bacterium]
MSNTLLFIIVLNIFIATAFCMQCLTTLLSSKIQLTQQQTLLYSRIIFVFSISIFIAFKILGSHLAGFHINTSIPQFTQHFSSAGFAHNNASLQLPEPYSISYQTDVQYWQYMLFVLIIVVGAILYMQQLYQLRKLVMSSLYQKSFGHLHLIYSNTIQQPQCFSYLRSSYVVLPILLLDNSEELAVVIKHELQHLRQHDGWFRHLLAIVNIFCWWNPLYQVYIRWFLSVQEFACDEALIITKQLSAKHYAQVLLAIAKKVGAANSIISLNIAAGIFGVNNNHQQLKRRIYMLSNFPRQTRRHLAVGIIFILALVNSIVAYALNSGHELKPVTQQELAQMVANLPDNQLQVQANDKVLKALNAIVTDPKIRSEFNAGLQRMQGYRSSITAQLTANKLPQDLLATPLLESSYQALPAIEHKVNTAGIWQLSAHTAKHFGLIINSKVDERLNTKDATYAALTYLSDEHARFKSWPLAIISYDAGTRLTQKLIRVAKSDNPWKIISHKKTIPEIKQYLPMIDASIIIIHNPQLVK